MKVLVLSQAALLSATALGDIYTTVNPCKGIPNCIITGTRTFHDYGRPTGGYGGSSSSDDDDDDSYGSSGSSYGDDDDDSGSSSGSSSSSSSSSDDDDNDDILSSYSNTLGSSSKAKSSGPYPSKKAKSDYTMSSIGVPSSLKALASSASKMQESLPSSVKAKLSSMSVTNVPTKPGELSKALSSLKELSSQTGSSGDDDKDSGAVQHQAMIPLGAGAGAFAAGVAIALL